jgi:dihydroorotate dehydrogenase subfamily 2
MGKAATQLLHLQYRYGVRPLLFLLPSEVVHERLTLIGEQIGQSKFLRQFLASMLATADTRLSQDLFGIHFSSPIGLSAGFDYKAQLTMVASSLGFGFETIGTITNHAYAGNPSPRLGRLVKSKSLLVNKGFKNTGVDSVLAKLSSQSFSLPVGISIGRTNSRKITTVQDSIQDICEAFTKVKESKIPFSYYELNISCPNLFGNVSFYPPQHLKQLLTAVFAVGISKPLFIKMPIEKSDEEVVDMLEVITQFPVSAVIFGNLQKNRQDPSLVRKEMLKYPVGNFSGKPTQRRSDELIALTYRLYGKRVPIIGCGGVFTAADAYRKICLGASLVQMITGLIFEGPQVVSEINQGLGELLRRDGFSTIAEAVGVASKKK